MIKWAEDQPKEGDAVIGCGHLLGQDRPSWQWFKLVLDDTSGKITHGVQVRRPDGTTFEAKWLVACKPCCVAAKWDPTKIQPREDFLWTGDDPVVRAETKH